MCLIAFKTGQMLLKVLLGATTDHFDWGIEFSHSLDPNATFLIHTTSSSAYVLPRTTFLYLSIKNYDHV